MEALLRSVEVTATATLDDASAMLDGMNLSPKAALLLTFSMALTAQNRLQFGPHLSALTVQGEAVAGLRTPFLWVGGQVRFDLGQGHTLQAIVGGTRLSGSTTQVFRIDQGYHYEVPLQVALNTTLVQAGAEYHYFPSRVMGQGFHGILGFGLAFTSLEKEVPPHFDMPHYFESTQTSPLLTLGVGYHLHRWLALNLRATLFQAGVIGTQVDPVNGDLDRRTGTVSMITLGTSFFFR